MMQMSKSPSIQIVRTILGPILFSRLLLRVLDTCVASFFWTSTKNEWNAHLSREKPLVQERFDLRS